jgi:hypothetical protein
VRPRENHAYITVAAIAILRKTGVDAHPPLFNETCPSLQRSEEVPIAAFKGAWLLRTPKWSPYPPESVIGMPSWLFLVSSRRSLVLAASEIPYILLGSRKATFSSHLQLIQGSLLVHTRCSRSLYRTRRAIFSSAPPAPERSLRYLTADSCHSAGCSH